MQNIGIAFVKLGQYNEAITSFEHVLAEEPNFITGFNLILCYFAMGDRSVVIGDNCVVMGEILMYVGNRYARGTTLV